MAIVKLPRQKELACLGCCGDGERRLPPGGASRIQRPHLTPFHPPFDSPRVYFELRGYMNVVGVDVVRSKNGMPSAEIERSHREIQLRVAAVQLPIKPNPFQGSSIYAHKASVRKFGA